MGRRPQRTLPELVGELVRLNPRVILTVSLPAALAAKNVTSTTPIVFIARDPLRAGLVTGLARPGGNVTGLSLFLGDDFSSKWLELLREVMPTVSRVAVLVNRTNSASVGYLRILHGTAQSLGISLQLQDVRDAGQFDGSFAAMVAARAQALVVVVDPLVSWRPAAEPRRAAARALALLASRRLTECARLPREQ
jgi:putative ABC transport system substrate-binding protein